MSALSSIGRFDVGVKDGAWAMRVRSPNVNRNILLVAALIVAATVPLAAARLVDDLFLFITQMFGGIAVIVMAMIRSQTANLPGAARLVQRALVVKDGGVDVDGTTWPFSSVHDVLIGKEITPTNYGGSITVHRILIVLDDVLIDSGAIPQLGDAMALCDELRKQLKLPGRGPRPSPFPPFSLGALWLGVLVLLIALGLMGAAPMVLLTRSMRHSVDLGLVAASAAAVLATALGGGWAFGRVMRGAMLRRTELLREWVLEQ